MQDTAEGKTWFRPIGLPDEDEFSRDEDELTKAPDRRGKITAQIPEAVLAM